MYSTKQFTYSKDTSTLTAEASDLGWPVGFRPDYLDLRSEHTGRVVRFHHITYQTRLRRWIYQAAVSENRVITMHIWND
jgi:hypothetical protein